MKIRKVEIHNFRSIETASFTMTDYTLVVGPNNAGKSNLVSAIRVFYEDVKWTAEDEPKWKDHGAESWIEITYALTDEEFAGLPEKYKSSDHLLVIRKVLASAVEERVRDKQSNLYANVGGELEPDLFFGVKNIGQARLGRVTYIPALSVPGDHLKMSGASALRDVINLLFKADVKKAEKHPYHDVVDALTKLESHAKEADGFLARVSEPLNKALQGWDVKMELVFGELVPEDICKNLIRHSFRDHHLSGSEVALERFGQGFQRAVIYELLRTAPRSQAAKPTKAKTFDPQFDLLLFEEPEAFLHPHQQEVMATGLRQLGEPESSQVMITTHSPIFVGRSADKLTSIIRVQRKSGRSSYFQISQEKLEDVLKDGLNLLKCLEDFVADPAIPDTSKGKAREMLKSPPADDIATQEEQFRYQLYLDANRAALFFAEKVLIVEGPTEKALFDFLLHSRWTDLLDQRIYVLETLGKFNVHRFIALLDAIGMPHGILIDADNGRAHHAAINAMIEGQKSGYRLADPVKFAMDLETTLGLPRPRRDMKPVEMLKALSDGRVSDEKLNDLLSLFKSALACA